MDPQHRAAVRSPQGVALHLDTPDSSLCPISPPSPRTAHAAKIGQGRAHLVSPLNIAHNTGSTGSPTIHSQNHTPREKDKEKDKLDGEKEIDTNSPRSDSNSEDSHKFSLSESTRRPLTHMGSSDDLERKPYDDDLEQSSRIYEKCVSLSYLRGSGTLGSGNLGSGNMSPRGARRSGALNYEVPGQVDSPPGVVLTPNKLRGETGDLSGRQLAENLLAKRNREERLKVIYGMNITSGAKSPPTQNDSNQQQESKGETANFTNGAASPVRESGRLHVAVGATISPTSTENTSTQHEAPSSPGPTSPRGTAQGQAKGLQKLKQMFHKKAAAETSLAGDK
eukprot:CAMPEP_0184707634 /NCGR_PEP_ID=MMETSP0313-20130426/37369_1 /TAXON_ID=2792 /ORGANISM="Porphyridium aerugineum, Strain SAG 1380-2" /LENGTH=336 /DNA_ID=CAMNT_0027169213 /DNA_START=1828 /DNA_END=2838 /DNA_ORIENTATION=+